VQQALQPHDGDGSFQITLSRDWVTIDAIWTDKLDLLDSYTITDYTSQITITHKSVFSVSLLGSGFNGGGSPASGLTSLQDDGYFTPTSYSDRCLQLLLPSAASSRAGLTSGCQTYRVKAELLTNWQWTANQFLSAPSPLRVTTRDFF
jgi:hypothetical protein